MSKNAINRAIRENDYDAMVRLYERHGTNKALKLLFAGTKNDWTRKQVVGELNKLLPLLPDESQAQVIERVRKIAVKPRRKSDDPDAPKEVRALVVRRKMLYARMNYCFGVLHSSEDKEVRFKAAKELLDGQDEIIDIWTKTDFYDLHGSLPKETQVLSFELDSLNEVQLQKRRNNLRTYLSKYKNDARRAADLAAWQQEVEQIEKMLEDAIHTTVQLK
jgi:hypothetical protein